MSKEEKKELIEGFSNYVNSQNQLSIDNINVMKVIPALLKLQNDKSLIYGRSWCKHGELSCFFNLERKWDRIQNIMEHAMEEGIGYIHGDEASTPTETFTDTIVDLASYSLLWMSYIYENYPEEWEKFIKANELS